MGLFGMWDVGCGMWDVGCGMRDVGCGMWDVGCGMWDVGCGEVGCGVVGSGRAPKCLDSCESGVVYARTRVIALLGLWGLKFVLLERYHPSPAPENQRGEMSTMCWRLPGQRLTLTDHYHLSPRREVIEMSLGSEDLTFPRPPESPKRADV